MLENVFLNKTFFPSERSSGSTNLLIQIAKIVTEKEEFKDKG
jgi:hypothetical protein